MGRERSRSRRRVFISYEHASIDLVRRLVRDLAEAGIDVTWDKAHPGGPPEGWGSWVDHHMDKAHRILVVATTRYIERFRGRDGGVGVEAEMILNNIGPSGRLRGRILVGLVDGPPGALPPGLAGVHRLNLMEDLSELIRLIHADPPGSTTPPSTEDATPSRRPPPALLRGRTHRLGPLPFLPHPARKREPAHRPPTPASPLRRGDPTTPRRHDRWDSTTRPPQTPPAHPPLQGTLANRYEIRGRLDEGGEGVVYEAWDTVEERALALKVRSTRTGPDHLLIKREFQALAAVRHPNVARAFDFIEDAGRQLAFFTMELVRGVDFLTHVRRVAPAEICQANLARLRRTTRQFALGLQAIHDTGRAHRDIKPENILVTADDRVVLLDFGLAARTSPADHLTIRFQSVEGTPQYMAPERFDAHAPVSPEADLYALGVVLFEVITGKAPPGPAARPRRTSEFVREVPRDLDDLIFGLLAPTPSARATLSDVLAWCRDPTNPLLPPLPALLRARDLPFDAALPSLHPALSRIYEVLRGLQRGDPRALVIHGPAGAGKSDLVRHALAQIRAADPHALVLTGRCSPREAMPFRALDAIVDALAAFLRACPIDQRRRLTAGGTGNLTNLFPVLQRVPGLGPPAPLGRPDPGVRTRAFQELRALLGLLSATRPLILAIDDLHRADSDSLSLLNAITAPPGGPTMMLLATLRGNGAEAEEFSAALLATPELVELPLPTPQDAAPYILPHLRAAGRDDPALALALARACAGDIRLASRLAGFAARLPPIDAAELHLTDLVAPVLAQLTPLARLLLELLALAEGPTPIDVLDRASAAGGRAHATLARLSDLDLIEIETRADDTSDATAEYVSPALRQVLARGLTTPRQADHHRALALAHGHSSVGNDARCAHHWIAAGDLESARDHAATAALLASRALAFDHAAKLYALALRCDPGSRETRVKLAHALAHAGDHGHAAHQFQRAAEIATGHSHIDLATQAVEHYFLAGDADRGLSVAKTVLSELGLAAGGDAEPPCLAKRLGQLGHHPLDFRERPRLEIPSAALQRVEALLSVGNHVSDRDPPRAALVLIEATLGALALGEPHLVGRAFALTAPVVAPHDRQLAHRLLARSRALTSATAHERGLIALSDARLALHEGDLQTVFPALALAEPALTAHPHRWELRSVAIARLIALSSRGDIHALSAAVDDLTRGTHATIGASLQPWLILHEGIAFLAGDEWERAERRALRIDTSKLGLPLALTDHFSAFLDLYQGRPDKPWGRYIGPYTHTGQDRHPIALHRLPAHWWPLLEARIALACAAQPHGDHHHREVLTDALAILARHAGTATPTATVHGELALLRAGLAALDGHKAAALRLLDEAGQHFQTADIPLRGAIVRLRRGELIGGPRGEQEARAACQQLRTAGIAHPTRWSSALAPGFTPARTRAHDPRPSRPPPPPRRIATPIETPF